MPEFHYAALNEKGARFAGTMEADDKNEALKALTERYSVVTRLEKKAAKSPFLPFFKAIKGEDVLSFSQTLAAMMEGGIPLKRALDTIYHDVQNRAMRGVIMDLSSQLGSGVALSKALTQHSDVFDKFYVSMVQAGEDSGELPEMLERVSLYVEKSEALKDTVKSALTYPIVILVFAFVLVAAILGFGVPFLRELYDGLGMELPASTKILVLIGGFLGDHTLICLTMLVVGAYSLRVALTKSSVITAIDRFKLTAPKLGEFFRILYTARFARTLSLLYASGIPLLNALKLGSASVGNSVFTASMKDAEEAIKAGDPLSTALRDNPYFLDSAVGMVSAGEESGKLDKMLDKVARFYEHKVNTQLESVTSAIEPLMMILIGIVIGGIIIALGLPFLNLASQI